MDVEDLPQCCLPHVHRTVAANEKLMRCPSSMRMAGSSGFGMLPLLRLRELPLGKRSGLSCINYGAKAAVSVCERESTCAWSPSLVKHSATFSTLPCFCLTPSGSLLSQPHISRTIITMC
ncbi:hypothetical protein AOLI_G00006220 [Acnodon oligacanthus]